jgi:hypothetical protein
MNRPKHCFITPARHDRSYSARERPQRRRLDCTRLSQPPARRIPSTVSSIINYSRAQQNTLTLICLKTTLEGLSKRSLTILRRSVRI